MKIGELARRAGLHASAIRYYEKLGLLAPPHRTGGQRRYPPDALDRVLLIRFAGEMGFSLAEIKLFLSGLRDRKSTRLNSSHITISYAVFCLTKKRTDTT